MKPLQVSFRRGRGEGSPLWVWEFPVEGCRYYIGADAARGLLDPDGNAQGDFSAAIGFNGTTGNQAFTFADRMGVEEFSWVCNALGRYYFRAMINVEQTGGDGSQVNKILRDKYHYPTLYGWLGKDDKRYKKQGNALGWETTWRSRQKMLICFREFIRPIEDKEGFLKIRDKRLYQQMGSVMRDDLTVRWEVKRGHDDLFVAAAIAAVALDQYPPPKVAGVAKYLLNDDGQQALPLDYASEPIDRMKDKWARLSGKKINPNGINRLEGVW